MIRHFERKFMIPPGLFHCVFFLINKFHFYSFLNYVFLRMKKAGNIVVILLLLFSTGGLTITRHYCGDSAVSFSFFSTPKPCCGNDCNRCHNEFSFNKITDEFYSPLYTNANVDFNLVHGNLFINQAESIPDITVAVTINSRKFLSLKTGDFPVSFGNFRC